MAPELRRRRKKPAATGNTGQPGTANANGNDAPSAPQPSAQSGSSAPEIRETRAAAARRLASERQLLTDSTTVQAGGSRELRPQGGRGYREARISDESLDPGQDKVRPDNRNIYSWYLSANGRSRVSKKSKLNLKKNDAIHINQFLQIVPMGNKNRGIVTRRAVPAGFLLWQEPALVQRIHPKPTDNEKSKEYEAYKERARTRIHGLSKDDRLKFLSLCFKGSKDNEESRVESNAFRLTEGPKDDRRQYDHLWYYMSMLNHSCIPNAMLQSKPSDDLRFNLRSRVAIPKGTEVTINYKTEWEDNENLEDGEELAPLMKAERRRNFIEKHWGFKCACRACTDPKETDKTNQRLEDIRDELQGAVYDLDDEDDRDEYAGIITEYIDLLKHFRLVGTIHRVAQDAINFMSSAIEYDDPAQGFTVEWQREALDAAVAPHGLEALADPSPDLGDGFVVTDREHGEHLLDIVEAMPDNMRPSYADAIIPEQSDG